MRFSALLCLTLAGCVVLTGCDTSQVSEQDIEEQKEKINELQKELAAAKEEKAQAVKSASADARKEAEEKVTDLESKLQEERDQLAAMQERHKFENQMVSNLQEMDSIAWKSRLTKRLATAKSSLTNGLLS